MILAVKLDYMILQLIIHLWSSDAEKKGFSFIPKDGTCLDYPALTNISWWYDWDFDPSYDYMGHHMCSANMDAYSRTHVPMIWSFNTSDMSYMTAPFGTEALLTFYVPNHKEKSDIPPEIAASHWPEVETVAQGVPLVSPSASPCDDPEHCLCDVTEWFDRFFNACSSCKVDYLATHVYSCDPHYVMMFLKGLHNRYHKKIWLTEFACPRTHDPHKQLNFMKNILPMLEAADFIHRYAWYSNRVIGNPLVTESSSLFQTNTAELTALGIYYNNFQSPPHENGIVG